GAEIADRLPRRAKPPAAGARRRSRARDDRQRRTAASVPGPRLQVRGPRPQHDSRRGRRGDPQRGAHGARGTAVSVVMKFGGTSVADADAIERVAAIVRRQMDARAASGGPIVVVSALAKVTDRLLDAARLAEAGDAERAAGDLTVLLERHLDACSQLVAGDARAT